MIGILLAGGQARRFGGGDKGRHVIAGVSILDRIVARMRPQCTSLIMNANGDPERFGALGLQVVSDAVANQPGPLAGVLAGLDHVAAFHPRERWAVTVPTDTPFLPMDLVARFLDVQARDHTEIVYARSGGREHYVAGLWDVALRDDLRGALGAGGPNRVSAFVERYASAQVDWPLEPYDPFFNVNTLKDLEQARRIAAEFDRDA